MTSKPANLNEIALALNERMNALENELQGVRRDLAALTPTQAPPALPDLAPLEARVDAALGDMRLQARRLGEDAAKTVHDLGTRVDEVLAEVRQQTQQLTAQVTNTANELEARTQRAITSVNLLTRKGGTD